MYALNDDIFFGSNTVTNTKSLGSNFTPIKATDFHLDMEVEQQQNIPGNIDRSQDYLANTANAPIAGFHMTVEENDDTSSSFLNEFERDSFALRQDGVHPLFMHPTLYSNDVNFQRASVNTRMRESDINNVNVFDETEDQELLGKPLKKIRVNGFDKDQLGQNLLETQHRMDQMKENLFLKEHSEGQFKEASEEVLSKLQDLQVYDESIHHYTMQARDLYKVMFDMYGNKLESFIKQIMCQQQQQNATSHVQDNINSTGTANIYNQRENTNSNLVHSNNMFMSMLNPNNVEPISRKDTVVDFFRPAIPGAGERSCINGGGCQSIAQFHQLYIKDPVLFTTCWKLKLDPKTNKLLDKDGQEFNGFPAREFLYPSVERKRKMMLEMELAQFLNDQVSKPFITTTTTSGGGGDHSGHQRQSELSVEIDKWLIATQQKVNAAYPQGYCIFCLRKLRSEISTAVSTASLVTNPNLCAVVQHHTNLFGIPGEYKQGTQINRRGNLCGLVGMALEYRVDHYVPTMATVNFPTLTIATPSTNPIHSTNTTPFTVNTKQIGVLQWSEVDDIVCNLSQQMELPKTST
jgi:hypothetical protein